MILAVDIETNGAGTIDVFRDKIILIGLVLHDGDKSQEILLEQPVSLPAWIHQMLKDPSVVKLVHNVPFDMKFIQHKFGILAENCWDTLAIERLLTAGTGADCHLEAVASRRLGITLDKSIRKSFVTGRIGDAEREYCLQDARVLIPIWMQQADEVRRNRQQTAADIENQMGLIVTDMELQGIGFDRELWDDYVKIIQQRRDQIELNVTRELGLAYTPGMFGGIDPAVRLTQRDKVLELLAKRGIELPSYQAEDLLFYIHGCENEENANLVKRILEYKKWDKALDWDYPRYIHPITQRIHASFNSQGADTLRIIASAPNLQQVAKPFSDEINFRHLFRAKEGYSFVGADYNQIELRALADVTNDEDYIRAFSEGLDLHKMAAEKVLGRELKSKAERNLGKAINFGIAAYGGGSKALMGSAADYDIFLTEREAKRYVAAIKAKNTVIERWGKRVTQDMLQLGHIQTPIGHRRYLPGEMRETVARNTHIQPFAAGIIKDGMSVIFKRLPGECDDAHIVLQVHDELLVECKDGEAERVQSVVVDELRVAGQRWLKKVPVEVDSYISKTWEK